ncbi:MULTISPECIES: transposase family protein, partial [unclassified Okeania]|uniref:transposase family protein n=1 Tax=unclassified Okeania TaxID=2634635 RepID=UPI0025D5DFA3
LELLGNKVKWFKQKLARRMLNIERALKQDRLLRALTGLNRKAFESLLKSFHQIYQQTLLEKPRQRSFGGGRKARLRTSKDKLFYILFYFKCYPTFDLASILFDIDRSQAHHWTHRLQPILETALGEKKALPERQINSVQAFIERFPGVERVVMDGTERPVKRPTDSETQKLNYSGKKKRHTRKHLAAVNQSKQVLVLSQAREGKLHDKKFHDEEKLIGNIPAEIPIEVDSGFQGIQHQYENIRIPHKKPKGGELTQQQKTENRTLSQSRVICENAFAGVKRYGAVNQIYRNHKHDFDDKLMLTATGLWNLYLMAA